jgi:hypothetical protein
MPLDTRIALTGQPLQLESPVAQYGQLMSLVNAGTQNQLAQMQISAAQRAQIEEENVKNYLADPANDLTTAEGQRGLLPFGAKGQAVLKSLAEQRKLQTEEDKAKYDFHIKTLDRAISDLTNLTDLPSAFASIDRQVAAKSITPQQGAELKTRINNAPDFSTWQNQTITGMLDAKERLGAMAEQQYQAFLRKPTAAAPAAAALPPQATATVPINDTRAALMPVPAERSVNAIQLGDGNVVYRVDGKDVPFAVYADAVKGRNQAQGANAAIAAAPGMVPAGAVAAPTLPAPVAPAASAAQPDMANALALKIQGLQDERNKLVPFLRSSSAKTQYEDLGKQIDNLSKGFSIAPDGTYVLPNVGTFKGAASLTPSQKEQAVLDDPNATKAQIANATLQLAKLNHIPEKAMSDFEKGLAASNLPETEKSKLRNAWLKSHSEHAPGTTVNVNAGQKAEDVELGKYVVDQYKDISTRADVATRSLPALDINLKTLEKGFDTGFGTETIAAGAKVLAALGVQNAAQFATDSQTFLANANSAVLQKQLEQKGVQTAADADRITSTGAQLGNTKEANKFIISVAKAQLQRDIAQRKFYSDWREDKKTFKGAEDAWYAGPGSVSLFDSPILKKYAEPVADQAEKSKKMLDKIFKKTP